MDDYGRKFLGSLQGNDKAVTPTELSYLQGVSNSIQNQLDARILKRDSNILVTVGSGGDFSTINQALEYLSHYYPLYIKGGFTAEIKLLSGFVMEEQVLVNGIDLLWITITSEAEEVIINRSSLTTEVENLYPAFYGTNKAKLPIIGVLFNMNSSGDATSKSGFFVTRGSFLYILPYCGCINAGHHGCSIYYGSSVIADFANFSNSGYIGINVSTNSSCICKSANILNTSTNDGIYVIHNSIIDANGADVSNSHRYGIMVYRGSTAAIANITAKNCLYGVYCGYMSFAEASSADATDCSTHGFSIRNGSLITASGATGTLNVTENTLSADGIIFK